MVMTGVLFCFLAAHDIAGVSTFAIFYGLSSGTCEFLTTDVYLSFCSLVTADITLMAPVLSLLAEHPSEIGSVKFDLLFEIMSADGESGPVSDYASPFQE